MPHAGACVLLQVATNAAPPRNPPPVPGAQKRQAGKPIRDMDEDDLRDELFSTGGAKKPQEAARAAKPARDMDEDDAREELFRPSGEKKQGMEWDAAGAPGMR